MLCKSARNRTNEWVSKRERKTVIATSKKRSFDDNGYDLRWKMFEHHSNNIIACFSSFVKHKQFTIIIISPQIWSIFVVSNDDSYGNTVRFRFVYLESSFSMGKVCICLCEREYEWINWCLLCMLHMYLYSVSFSMYAYRRKFMNFCTEPHRYHPYMYACPYDKMILSWNLSHFRF